MLLGLMGSLILITVLYDFFTTTLTVTGGGPLTSRLNHALWTLCRRMKVSHSKLAMVGPALAFLTVLLWTLAIWLGWSLIYCADVNAVLEGKTEQPARAWQRVYFVGFTLTTLGIGDYKPGSALWQIMTVLTAGNGLFLITMSITYIMPIVSAAAEKRALATRINSLGTSPQKIVLNAWNGEDCKALAPHLCSLTQAIAQQSQQHLTYPILHYFHSQTLADSLPLRLAALDEALTIFEQALPESNQPDKLTVLSTRKTCWSFLDNLASAFIDSKPAPPAPDLTPLQQAGLPVVAQQDFQARVAELERRELLRGWVENDARNWEQVAGQT